MPAGAPPLSPAQLRDFFTALDDVVTREAVLRLHYSDPRHVDPETEARRWIAAQDLLTLRKAGEYRLKAYPHLRFGRDQRW